jgi:hypothetical protein
MVTTTETIIQAKRVFVIGVQEAPWNVNVLQGEKYEQLGADMKAAELEISVYANFQATVRLVLGEGTPVDLKFDQNGTDNKTFATYVRTATSRQLASKQALKDLEEAAADFVGEYGKMPRGMNPDVLQREKRTKK